MRHAQIWLAAVALGVVVLWQLAPAEWTYTAGCASDRSHLRDTSPDRVNRMLDDVLGPAGTRVSQRLLLAVLARLHIDTGLSTGYIAMHVGQTTREFRRSPIDDTVWVRTR